MALNPFFLQGSQSEQRLIQELINEQLTIYGIEVIYLPRKIINQDTILNEIQSSKYDDNFAIEAYVNTYEGYGGAGDIMTKFGVSLKDELTVTISKERFEDFISPYLGQLEPEEINLSTRPREGDLIYFPLGSRLFEVKFVEHEQPFYQLGKNYVYQLKCELFEYSDELGGWNQLSTTTQEIDSALQNQGYITSLTIIGSGTTAQITPISGTGFVKKIFLNNDGSGYTSVPTISFTDSPEGTLVSNASAVAITTISSNVYSIQEILLTNAGFGYTEAPTITISGGGGSGAIATCSIETEETGIVRYSITSAGTGYPIPPEVTVGVPIGPGAAATATISGLGNVNGVTITNDGKYYNQSNPPIVTFSAAPSGVVNAGSISTTGAGHVNGGNYDTTGGSGTGFRIQGQGSGGMIGFTILSGGQGYVVGDIVATVNSNPAYIEITGVTDHTTATGISSVSSAGIVTSVTITNAGTGYTTAPTVSIANTVGNKDYSNSSLITAIAKANVSTDNRLSSINIINPGSGYDPIQPVTVASPPTTGIGTFTFNELVTGSISGAQGRVKTWDTITNTLKLGTTNGTFVPGDIIVGSASSAKYSVDFIESAEFADKYDAGVEIEEVADTNLDFSESNPFGTY